MNIAANILQVLLGLWMTIGGTYMIMNYTELLNTWATAQPSFLWITLASIQIIAGLSLVLSVWNKLASLKTPSAWILTIISLVGIGIYSEYSGFPGLLWGVIPALLLSVIAFKRA